LFATLTGRAISVAAEGLKAIEGSDPDRIGIFDRGRSKRRRQSKKEQIVSLVDGGGEGR